MAKPAASVIVRARNEEAGIGRALASLRRQTVEPEIIVVDSGSTDGTLDIARTMCDRLIEIPAASFSYGRALNIGAEAAQANVHFALSAHCEATRVDWVQRTLARYERDDVAGACGGSGRPDGEPLEAVFHQTAADARANPYWGFSNHASSWRASVWREFPFHEGMDYAEDKEWAWRVLHAGWVIAYEPALWVDMSHQWRGGTVDFFERQRRGARALATFAPLPPYGLRELGREWWNDLPEPRRRGPFVHRFLNHRRLAGLAGKYLGHRPAIRRPR
jgi:rhamnosyltransferase